MIVDCTLHNMHPKPAEELTAVEMYLLGTAARLQAAVRWVERNAPPPERWASLNDKVKDEIVCDSIFTLLVYTDIMIRRMSMRSLRHM